MKFLAFRLFLPAIALLFAAACASDPACAIADNGDGTRMIKCPGQEPVRVVAGGDGTTCTIGKGEEEGVKIISCSDGTVVRIVDGVIVEPGNGTIEGRAVLFGMPNHEGIRITVEGTAYETTTDADGNYVLGPIPAGIHVVLFEAPGRITERRENIPLINGAWMLDRVELKFARRVAAGGADIVPSPDGEALLAFTSVGSLGGWLSLWELGSGDELALGAMVSSYAFSDDGKLVLFQEKLGLDGPLQLWDREAGVQTEVAARSVRGAIAPGGESVVYETLDDANACELYVWRRETRISTRVDGCSPFFATHDGGRWMFGPDGKRFIYMNADQHLVVRDIPRATNHLLSTSFVGMLETRFLSDGRHVLVVEFRDDFSAWDLLIFDAETGARRTLVADTDGTFQIAPDGGTILAWRNWSTGSPNLVAYRVIEDTTLVVHAGSTASRMAFSPDGSRLLWIEGQDFQAGPLHVLDLRSPENLVTYTARAAWQASFGAVGTAVLVQDGNGELHLWDPVTGTDELLEVAPGFWAWAPDFESIMVQTSGNALLVADLANGARHRQNAEGVFDVRWTPDGDGLVYARLNETNGADLMLWEPPADPKKIGSGSFPGILASDEGSIAFLECRGTCAGDTLVLWHAERKAREPIDVPASNVQLRNRVLWYQLILADDAERSGIYAMPLP